MSVVGIFVCFKFSYVCSYVSKAVTPREVPAAMHVSLSLVSVTAVVTFPTPGGYAAVSPARLLGRRVLEFLLQLTSTFSKCTRPWCLCSERAAVICLLIIELPQFSLCSRYRLPVRDMASDSLDPCGVVLSCSG